MNKETVKIESLERQLVATQAEVNSLRSSIAQLFQLMGSVDVKIADLKNEDEFEVDEFIDLET
tara:strand:+ start:1473 stop:1661 length:189 start_codon:yes stop_codon:yes gene_type:complete